jgi:cytochrome b pre-mRNA-processing protein 3
MLPRWSRAVSHLRRLGTEFNTEIRRDFHSFPCRNYPKVAAAVMPPMPDATENRSEQVNLNKMFWSKPCSLALPPDSPLRIDEPKYEGIRRFFLRLMLFYSKQSKCIRQSNAIYRRVVSQVDKPDIYDVFRLEKTFKTTFSLLVLHMWLILRRMKEEGKEGVDLGQYLYETYNHNVEIRVSKAGVNLLLSRWMKDLEKIFYGNVVAYDAAIRPEAKHDELQKVIWRNVFSDDGALDPDDAALHEVQAMARYVKRECSCLSLTDKEAILSGNFMFTPLKPLPDSMT